MGKTVPELSELAEQPASGDLLYLVDVSDTTDSASGTSKKIQFSNLSQTIASASTSAEGIVELATDAETITGTDTARAVTPSNITAKMDTDGTLAGNLDTRIPSQKAVKTYGDRTLNTTLNINPLHLPQGFPINGKISVTDTGSGLTVAVKTLAGTDPSASDPIYCRIGDTVRTISAALSKTIADGVNYMNSGSSELATKEIDYFVHIGWNASASTPFIGWGRKPFTSVADIASYNTIDEKSLMCSQTNADGLVNSDYMEVVGRFSATLSAGAGYTWSVPTFTAINLIQRPIYETRWLDFVVTPSGSGSMGYGTITDTNTKYKIIGNSCKTIFNFYGTTTGTASNEISFVWPFSPDDTAGYRYAISTLGESTYVGLLYANSTKWTCRKYDNSNWGIGASRGIAEVISYGI